MLSSFLVNIECKLVLKKQFMMTLPHPNQFVANQKKNTIVHKKQVQLLILQWEF